MKKLLIPTLLSVALYPLVAFSADSGNIPDLGDVSLENLGNIVTSVSKKPEDSFRSAAAIYVITNEDIKLSGATHIAEALRGVPGLDVARIDSSNWAISSRGFNGAFSNKLLVLVDGRTIYTPLFGGVYWDIQNIPLEDVERIEVIRGPGASLWGANAVNGIINIITKNSADTQGTYASTLAGNLEKSITDVRYGGKISENAFYRVYAKYEDREETTTTQHMGGDNSWNNAKTGFRSDWKISPTSKLTLQGDAYTSNINLDLFLPSFTAPGGVNYDRDVIHSRGMNLQGKWDEKNSDTMQSTFQLYFDYQSPSYSSLDQKIYTTDFDYQTSWKADDRNDIVWGGGARFIGIDLNGSQELMIANDLNSEEIFSAFLQDQYALIPKDLYLTLGSKFEHNSFSGFEVEPSARLAWYPDNKQTVWGAVSRAVRTPTINEETFGLSLTQPAPGFITQQLYNRNFDSEKLIAYELGYRIKPTQKLSFDNTVFFNDYDRLETFEPLAPVDAGGGNFYLPYQASNMGKAQTYGFETSVNWDVASYLSLLANYSYINMVLDDNNTLDPTFEGQRGNAPHNQIMVRAQWFLPHDVRLVNTAYYVSRLATQNVDAYLRFDTQAIWQVMPGFELSVVGQNLFDERHPEFGAPLSGVENEIPRSFYARITLRY